MCIVCEKALERERRPESLVLEASPAAAFLLPRKKILNTKITLKWTEAISPLRMLQFGHFLQKALAMKIT